MLLRGVLAVLTLPIAAVAAQPVPAAVESALIAALGERETCWMLVAADGRRWQRGFSDQPIPPGSLLKPFAALAWLEANAFEPPTEACDGEGCWLPSGHGVITLTAALAHSCNRYFSRLSASLSYEQIAGVALRYGLQPPPGDAPETWWGWGDGWALRPASLLEAYAELVRRSSHGNALVVEGLRRAAAVGTAAGVGRRLAAPALAKTGTAPCRHVRRSAGDGLAIILYPADNPRYTMLLQACGRTGRETAAAAGQALARLTAERGRPRADRNQELE
jgi:cell division protein FtsI/penicillin-binding protein 2